MLAFQKFGQKYLLKTQVYIFTAGIFALIGWAGVILVGGAKGPGVLHELKFATNLLLQGSAAMVFFMYVRKIFRAYMQHMLFSKGTLALIMSLARLMMLFAVVIQPGFYFFVELLSANEEISNEAGIVSYLAHVNVVLFAAGYALHLISAAHKVARVLEEEQDLTI